MSVKNAELELRFYEDFFLSQDLEPYPVQEQAIDAIFSDKSVMVTVPTGTGKTMMAKAALFKALHSGQKAVYTTPLRALTEEKFRELCADFGEENVGFATGDYKTNRDAPIQVEVAEILWNRIYGERVKDPAHVVVMDEGHYFNDPERGYVWEQSIIGLDPRAQLVILSATVGYPERFCQWVYTTRRVPIELVQSHERQVPLYHEYREAYLIEVVKELHAAGDTPAIIFGFSRRQCFDRARLLKSCPRFTTDEERERVAEIANDVLLDRGLGKELESYLSHGIGIHHAGILPRYKRLVEMLAAERLCKFIVSTETIAAGINLPAKRVVFPELRKRVKKTPRLLTSAEYHQMAGRAGRPQFDKEGIAITLAPEAVVQEIRREIKQLKRKGHAVDWDRIRKGVQARAQAEARRKDDVIWDEAAHKALVNGQPAPLESQTRVTPEQILAIGLPDLEAQPDEAARDLPPALTDLNIRVVIENLLLPDKARKLALQRVDQITANLLALGVIDERGRQVAGQIIGKLHGMDGVFVYYCLREKDLDYDGCRELVELLVEHDVIHRQVMREEEEKRREWILARLRERRVENPQVSWEDVEEEYEKEFPPVLSEVELVHRAMTAALPHPELHGGKVQKRIWAAMEDGEMDFMDFVERHSLEREEGSLFTYLARVMKAARTLADATGMEEFGLLAKNVENVLARIDARVLTD